jgi:methylated-DNA-[protein]-cysteine S-methyltransferase
MRAPAERRGLLPQCIAGLPEREERLRIYTDLDTSLGPILLVSDGSALTGLYFIGQKYYPEPAADWKQAPALRLFREVKAAIAAYFALQIQTFDIPLRLEGTSFQTRVWQAIAAIPFGKTQSYSALAESIGAPSSVRAVGGATGRNPVSLIVPCHRVIGRDGALTGYAGGLDRKRALLKLERGHHSNRLHPAATRL